MNTDTLPPRFWDKVQILPSNPVFEGTPCWLWTAARIKGYGQFKYKPGRSVQAHRLAYEEVHGQLAADLDLHHRCERPLCVNPAHLEVLSHEEHSSLHRPPRWTHCLRGHILTIDNVHERIRANGRLDRECLICRRAWKSAAKKRARQREKCG